MKKQAQFGSPHSREPAELVLTSCGYEICEADSQVLCPKGNHFALYAIRSGRGTWVTGGSRCQAEAQDLMLVYPDTECSFWADPQSGCTCLWVEFTGTRAEAYLRNAGFSRGQPKRRTQCIHQMEQILVSVLEAQGTASNQLRADGNFRIFLADLMEEQTPKDPGEALRLTRGPKTSEYIRTAMEYLAKHYPEDIKIRELADLVGINRSYFASSFKKATGCSPKEYLLRLRMERAKQLLETTLMPISSISSAVGYEDPLAFSRIFKRYSGLSPTNYREQNKSQFD